jgi:hypothetical protein
MKKICIVVFTLLVLLLDQSCKQADPAVQPDQNHIISYDMRNDLNPSRLTIAMWDFSWLYMHYPGGAFEDFDKVTDELLERGFNTVRIDAFPLITGKLDSITQMITIPGDSLRNWGRTDIDRLHAPVKELISFMEITKSKNINVILSSWGNGCSEFPDILKGYSVKTRFWDAWEKTLDILKERNLLSHVAYVDLDQEFPYFSPFQDELGRLEKINNLTKASLVKAMESAGENSQGYTRLKWNHQQMEFVHDLMRSTLAHFQKKYPQLRFTFSLTDFWKEVRALNLESFDVLELHFWMSASARFADRSQFGPMIKDRGKHDYSDYMNRINQTMKSIRPMLLKDMYNRLTFAREWSDEIAAPLVTTEAWGPWWHMDHKDLNWEFLYEWCAGGMRLASEYGLWGATPWNYSHPYWENWKNIEWYKKVNNGFLNK